MPTLNSSCRKEIETKISSGAPLEIAEAQPEPNQTSKKKVFVKTAIGLKLLTVFARSSIPLVFSCEFYRTSPVAASTKACNFTKKRLRQISICRWLFRKHNTINCDDNDDDFCFLILGRLLLLGSSWNEISLEVLQRLICVAAQPLYLG